MTEFRIAIGITTMLILSFAGFACSPSGSSNSGKNLPDPAVDDAPTDSGPAQGSATPESADADDPSTALREAVFAGGCFWCVEAVFEQLQGVKNVVSGYAGGKAETADYRTVSSGGTDHAEVVKVTYDPSVISYGQLLKIFFATHDPTQLNRQGPDVGPQYRSAVFYADQRQREIAERYIEQLREAEVFDDRIVTTLEPLDAFYPAEGYHQDYVEHNPNAAYVQAYALPKVRKVRDTFEDLTK